MKVTQQEIVEALKDISIILAIVGKNNTSSTVDNFCQRIKQRGIAPPDVWQPIETAPGHCLVYCDGDVFQARKTASGGWKCPDPAGGGEYWLDAAPTHWMPKSAPEVKP